MGIEAGDLVMVVKPLPCCGLTGFIGHTYKAGHIQRYDRVHCSNCRTIHKDSVVVFEDGTPNFGFLIGRLIKIDPPALLEKEERELELVLK
jgi:hypothetical protein